MSRYSFGGDEHLFVECDENMSLEAFFKSLFMTHAIRSSELAGIVELCPANASFQIKFDPHFIAPADLLREVKAIEASAERADPIIDTRIIEVPVFYRDPWTHETLMRFRDRHQDPKSDDLQYASRINGFADIDGFIKAHSGSRIRGWPAVSISDGGKTPTAAGAEIPAPSNRYAKANRRPRRMLLLHLLGSRRGRLSDVRHNADADL
jgi:Carboxyltransferase domain, subdomain C and D